VGTGLQCQNLTDKGQSTTATAAGAEAVVVLPHQSYMLMVTVANIYCDGQHYSTVLPTAHS